MEGWIKVERDEQDEVQDRTYHCRFNRVRDRIALDSIELADSVLLGENHNLLISGVIVNRLVFGTHF